MCELIGGVILEASAARLLKSFLRLRRINWNEVFLENLNLSQIGVLLTLVEYSNHYGNKNIIMSQLSEMCKITRPALTQIINGLEQDGLVKRVTSTLNRREVYVQATPKGEQIAHSEKKMIISFFNQVVEEMGLEETEEFINLLDKFYLIINNDISKE